MFSALGHLHAVRLCIRIVLCRTRVCCPSARRFKDNPYVNGKLGNIVFYAAAPLVTSRGHRLGSLCVVDYRPREFDAECCNMLANFAEIVVRDTERYTAALEELEVSDPAVFPDTGTCQSHICIAAGADRLAELLAAGRKDGT